MRNVVYIPIQGPAVTGYNPMSDQTPQPPVHHRVEMMHAFHNPQQHPHQYPPQDSPQYRYPPQSPEVYPQPPLALYGHQTSTDSTWSTDTMNEPPQYAPRNPASYPQRTPASFRNQTSTESAWSTDTMNESPPPYSSVM